MAQHHCHQSLLPSRELRRGGGGEGSGGGAWGRERSAPRTLNVPPHLPPLQLTPPLPQPLPNTRLVVIPTLTGNTPAC